MWTFGLSGDRIITPSLLAKQSGVKAPALTTATERLDFDFWGRHSQLKRKPMRLGTVGKIAQRQIES
jgi:hypothetical protein